MPVPSNLHISVWHSALTSYYDKEIVDFLEFGWAINYTAAHFLTSVSQNHPSACKHPGHVREFINREVNLHVTAGPFLSDPLDCGLMLSPLLTVPKKDSDTCRVVMDLSFPHSRSVNDGIPRDSYLSDSFHLHLLGVDALVTFVQTFGPGCLLFKIDLQHAYRWLPIDPRDYHFMRYQFYELLFFDTVFAFGLQSATLGCQCTTNAITYLSLLQGFLCTNYVDDFGGCNTPSKANDAFYTLKHLIYLLGLQTSPEKDCPSTTLMVFLGILIDTVAMTLSVPQEKIDELVHKPKDIFQASFIS